MNTPQLAELQSGQRSLQASVDKIKRHTPQTKAVAAASRELQSLVTNMTSDKINSQVLKNIASKIQSVIDQLEKTNFKNEAPAIMGELRSVKARIQSVAANIQ